MSRLTTRVGKAAVIAVLLAAVIAPGAATAAKKPVAKRDTMTRAQQRQAYILQRLKLNPNSSLARQMLGPALSRSVSDSVSKRQKHFDDALSRVQAMVGQISAISGRVGSVGGDVSAVSASISTAQDQLKAASALEAQAISQLNGVPGASSPRQAFATALASFHSANSNLTAAKQTTRTAAQQLMAAVQQAQTKAAQTPSAP
jgi:hypothetical protein